jgi:hypothetical protein
MKDMSATTSFELDRRRQKNNGSYPVKLIVTHNRKFKRYKTDFSMDPESFEKVLSQKPRGEYKDIRINLSALEDKARIIIKELPEFSFEAFEKKFLMKKSDWDNIFSAFDYQVKQIQSEGRISTASTYLVAKKSFLRFHGKIHLGFNEVSTFSE